MSLRLVFLLLSPGYSIKTLSFESSSSENISYKILKSSQRLPQIFTFCSSFKEHYVDDKSFFVIYGKSNKPWMTLSNWMKGDRIVMWLQINTVWQKVKVVPFHWINSWVHVCISADTHSGNISLSVKGDPPLKFYIPELNEEKPNNL